MLIEQLSSELKELRDKMLTEFGRHVSIQDLIADRWETAEFYGFGEGTSCYNNVLIIGQVTVGKNCWIGPNVVLDGSGGLKIGDYCSISAGSQIYSHHTVEWSNSLGQKPIETKSTTIGDGAYIGPNCIVQMGVNIGSGAVIGASSFVNRDVESNQKVFGVPARVVNEK
jgi:acetyltransferase-like isoleucine patch superfamily enzyme